ncbi:class I SAM-dependent methyltransferase [Deinococcus pimensis]|uniref:class I SAM-dependent methyltransferase n=1 Tax=Deinococcus pimensis TaxID=309888 RepID=UPI000480A4A9|nr:class I SAM-dependent methyltransferase [Deinococcus pimensis]
MGQEPDRYERRRRLLAELGRDPVRLVAARVPPHEAVLDVGCASGSFLSLLSGARSRVGVDVDARLVGRARAEVPGATFEIMDAADLRSLEARFDVVTVLHTLAHVVDPIAVLQACHDVLTAGGTLVAAVNASGHLREFWEAVGDPLEREDTDTPQDALLNLVGAVFPGAGLEIVTGRVRAHREALMILADTYSVPASQVERLDRHLESTVEMGTWDVTTRLGIVSAVRSGVSRATMSATETA